MGFKADTSFLRFLSMGAAGARQTMAQMRAAGFEPIELERYCTSNKIWSTKVKRLRLPDLLCVRTGLRVEVRAKSDLRIRMSDASNNPDRRWHSGLRDDDLAAFIACFDRDGTPVPAPEAVLFTVGDLRKTEGTAQLGPPKSASEGAERDRTWPSIVPSKSGVVESVTRDVLRVRMDADDHSPGRPQSYQLRGKIPYVGAGEHFVADASILAGTPSKRVSFDAYRHHRYEPLEEVEAREAVDRYAAVKSLPYRPLQREKAVQAIERRLEREKEARVLLEAAGAGTTLGSAEAHERLSTFLWDQERADLRMEAVLILTELRSSGARDILLKVATDRRFEGNEIRQAAVWGLGKAGLRRYEDLLPFIGDADRDVALHAVVAFGTDTPYRVIEMLIGELLAEDPRRAPAASEALRIIGGDVALARLVEAARAPNSNRGWILVTLGRMDSARVQEALVGDPLLDQLAPLLLLSKSRNC